MTTPSTDIINQSSDTGINKVSEVFIDQEESLIFLSAPSDEITIDDNTIDEVKPLVNTTSTDQSIESTITSITPDKDTNIDENMSGASIINETVKHRVKYTTKNPIIPLDDISKKKLEPYKSLNLPSQPDKVADDVMTKFSNLSISDNEHTKEWLDAIEDSIGIQVKDDLYESTLTDEENLFTTQVNFNNQIIRPKNVGIGIQRKQGADGKTYIEGEVALLAAKRSVGIGGLVTIPLIHSGFSITIKPPSITELIDLFHVMNNEKISLGRQTHGLSYSNDAVFTINHIIDFIFQHILKTTVNLTGEENKYITLNKIIDIHDISFIITGMAGAMFPEGVKVSRPCLSNLAQCRSVSSDKLAPLDMMLFSGGRLSEWHKKFLIESGDNSRTVNEILEYQKQLLATREQSKTIFINDDDDHTSESKIKVTFKTPSLYDYYEDGRTWVNSIVELVNTVIQEDPDGNARDKLITKHGNAHRLRYLSHWVSEIEVSLSAAQGGGNASVIDKGSIREMLGAYSENPIVYSKIEEGISSYMNKSAISLVGIPTYTCPVCKGENRSPKNDSLHDDFTNIIPIDAVTTFFILSRVKLEGSRVKKKQ